MNNKTTNSKGKHCKTKEGVLKTGEPKTPAKEGKLWIQCIVIFLLFFAVTFAIVKVDATCSKAVDSRDSFYSKKVEIYGKLN